MTHRRALWTLIVSSSLVRLFSACYLGLGNDEAYHSLYASHPALGYYDHPPMMAWIEMLGQALPGAGASAWALRIGFIVLFAGSTWLLARLTSRFYGERAGFLAALALNLTGYYGLAASTFALPDGPLLFFWLLCLDRLSIAIEPRGFLRAGAVPGPPPTLASQGGERDFSTSREASASLSPRLLKGGPGGEAASACPTQRCLSFCPGYGWDWRGVGPCSASITAYSCPWERCFFL